jgi:hypothetical protein
MEKVTSSKIILEFMKQIADIKENFMVICDGPDWIRQYLHPVALRKHFQTKKSLYYF